MVYTPVKTIVVTAARLTESTDLTKPLSSLVGLNAYLVVAKETFMFVLNIGSILTRTRGLVYTQPIGSVFAALLTDLFVAQFQTQVIPVKPAGSDLYPNRLRVLNPHAYKQYRVHYTSIQTPQVIDDPQRKGFLDDLLITAPDDLSQVLVAVCGVFHKTVYDPATNSVFVLDGFRTMRVANRRDVTVVDTRRIGGHTILPLTTSNTTKPAWQGVATVTTPTSLVGKTVFLVVDGYFYHRADGVIGYGDPNHVHIRTNRLPLIDQFRHNPRTIYSADRYGIQNNPGSRKYSDAYDAVFLDSRACPTQTLQTEDFQYSRLTHYHSFLVILNNPNVFTVTKDLLPTGTPQTYEDPSSTAVSGMMRYGCGLCPSYGIWENEDKRKTIFIDAQDYDVDRQDESLSPAFIPALVPELSAGTRLPARMIDYVSA